MAASTMLGMVSDFIREELSLARTELAPEVDGIFAKMFATSRGVTAVGRDFQAKVVFPTGLAGGFKNVAAAGPATEDQDYTGHGNIIDTAGLRVFPTVGKTAQLGQVTRTLTLVQGMGAFHLPIHLMQVDALDASITDSIARTVQGVAKNVNHCEAIQFYLDAAAAKHKYFAFVDASECQADAGIPSASKTVKVTVDGADCIGRIALAQPNMLFLLYDSSHAVQLGSAILIIHSVDWINRYFVLARVDGTALQTTDFSDGDYLRLLDSTVSVGPSGAETWLVSSGTPFGLSLTTHPEFKSLVVAHNGVLDGSALNKYIGGFNDAWGGLYQLDSLITTGGVMAAYLESLDGLMRYDVQGSRLKVKAGWVSMDYAWQGQEFEYLISRYQQYGQVYIMKTRDQNIKRYVTPTISGAGKASQFSGEIQFVAPLMGSSSIFLPGRDSSAGIVEHNECPFVYFREWCPDQLPGILLTGCQELNWWD